MPKLQDKTFFSALVQGKPRITRRKKGTTSRTKKSHAWCVKRTDTPQYVNFTISGKLDLLQFQQKEGRIGLHNIQHINSYHSVLKNFMRKFKGVSTKYLPNYLVWNNFENYANETFVEKHRILLEFIVTTNKKVLRKSYHQRPSLPFSVV